MEFYLTNFSHITIGSCNCGCTLTESSGRLQTKLAEATQFCRWTIQTKPGTKIAFSINRVRNIDWKNGGLYLMTIFA